MNVDIAYSQLRLVPPGKDPGRWTQVAGHNWFLGERGGAAVSDLAGEGLVTVLFTDVEGSTALRTAGLSVASGKYGGSGRCSREP